MNDFKQDILKKIKSGEVDMKPRWHFVLNSLLLVFSVITAVLVGIYLLSFVVFTLQQSGVGFMPLYGFRGIIIFIMNSPWILISFAGAAVIILQILVHKYSFSYRQPFVYTMIGVIVLVLLGSYTIEKTLLHQRLHGFVEQHEVPLVSPLYRGIEESRPDNIIVGTITEVEKNSFVIESDKEGTIEVIITGETRQHPGFTSEINDSVLVFGDRDKNKVTALGIRPAPKNFVDLGFAGKGQKGGLLNRDMKKERLDSLGGAIDMCSEVVAGGSCNFINGLGETIDGECTGIGDDVVCVPINSSQERMMQNKF